VPFEAVSAVPLVQAALFLAASAAALWICAAAAVWASQERIIFRPDARRLGEVPPRLAATTRLRLARLMTSDGLELAFWAAEPLPGRPTLVVFHGNAGNAADHAHLLAPFAEAGYGLVLAEYRGYGGNPGTGATPDAPPRRVSSPTRAPTLSGPRRRGATRPRSSAARASAPASPWRWPPNGPCGRSS
jgi:hypothetical protein